MASELPSPGFLPRLLLTLLFGGVALSRAQSPLTALKEVRYWSAVGSTRVAIELSQDVDFRHGEIQNPHRAFVDLVDVRLSPASFKGLAYSIPVDDGLVKKIRVAPNQARVTRVVLDLDGDCDVTASKLVNPVRIVLDVRRKGVPVIPPPPAVSQTAAPKIAAPAATVPDLGEVLAKTAPPPLPPPIKVTPTPPPAPPPSSSRAAESARLVTPSLTRALGLKLGRVMLDAGHGGHDPGSTGPNGLVEKELVLDVTLRLGRLLEERMGAEVLYTRKDDTFVHLDDRGPLANRAKADLFLSIHANSSPARSVVGTETYYLNRGSSREDLALAARENADSGKNVSDLNDLVKKIVFSDKRDESREFAARLQGAAHELTSQTYGKVYNRGVRHAPFVVLIGATMPAVLVELGFMSNPKEESLLKQDAHRQKIAEALYKGILGYARTLSHFSMARNPND